MLSRYPEELSWPAIYSRKTGTLDPLEVDYAQPWEHYAYLTLYPNPEMSRIVPYLYSLTQELSEFCCLTEELLVDNEDLFFPPVPSDTEAVSKNIQNRVEEDYQSVREHWMNTADDLKSHPLLAWSEGRETMIDAEIERLTTGTGSSDKEREPNDS